MRTNATLWVGSLVLIAGVAGADELPPASVQAQRLLCPEGTWQAGATPPSGNELWCEKLDAQGRVVKHGSTMAWSSAGYQSAEGEYRDGKRHGRWRFWTLEGRSASEGEYREGKQQGRWIFWERNGERRTKEFQDGEVIR
jgi:hypothetical protein